MNCEQLGRESGLKGTPSAAATNKSHGIASNAYQTKAEAESL